MFKTANLQNFVITSMGDDINVTSNSLYLYIQNLIPSVETQLMFLEATQINYKITFDKNYAERPVKKDLLVKHDIGSARQVNILKYLICDHQSCVRSDTPKKTIISQYLII